MVASIIKIDSKDLEGGHVNDDFIGEIALGVGFESFYPVIYETGEEALWDFQGYIRTDDPAGVHARLVEGLEENCDPVARVYTKWFKITPSAVFDTPAKEAGT